MLSQAPVLGGQSARTRPNVSPSTRATSVRRRVSLTRASSSVDAPASSGVDEWKNDRLTFQGHSVTRVVAPKNAPPIVILGGFGNNTVDYTAPFGNSSVSLANALKIRGFDVEVVELERKDWAKILRAVWSPGFWDTRKGTTEPGYTWYLEKVDEAVNKALERNPCSTNVDIVAHSAGGWLARAYIGGALNDMDFTKKFRYWAKEPQRESNFAKIDPTKPHPSVRSLVTLGAPHHVAPASANASDATRGALAWVDAKWPGAYYKTQGMKYVCVAGKTVRGNASPEAKKTLPGYSANSYTQVCGEGGGIIGDAVVPSDFATLVGALNVSVDGVFHSMSRVGTYDTDSKEAWYGSEQVVDLWLKELVD